VIIVFAKRILMTVVTVLAVSACTLDKQDAPDMVGPSGLGLSLDITASPDGLLRDGVAQSTIQITATDGQGNRIPDLGLQVVASLNLGTIQAGSVKTNSSGRASTVYVAPTFGPATTVTITVTPVGSNYQNTTPRTITIRLFQPTPTL
jgi:hypothetical protein